MPTPRKRGTGSDYAKGSPEYRRKVRENMAKTKKHNAAAERNKTRYKWSRSGTTHSTKPRKKK